MVFFHSTINKKNESQLISNKIREIKCQANYNGGINLVELGYVNFRDKI